MKNQNKQMVSTAFKWGSLGACALAAIVQALAMLLSYDRQANYFLVGAPLPYIAAALAVLGGACGILYACFLPTPPQSTPISASPLPSLPAAIGMLACAVLMFTFTAGTLSTVITVLLFLAALYSVLCGTRVQRAYPSAIAILGFSPIVVCALMNVYYYFDASLEMNAPLKVTAQTALLFAMLYYTAELRYPLGRQKPRLYLALAYATLAAASLPALAIPIAFACGTVTRIDCLAGAVLTLGIAITMVLRLYRLQSITPTPASEIGADTAPQEHPEEEENEAQ